MTSGSKYLVQLDAECRHAKSASGAALFGPDSALWPAIWWDIITALEMTRIMEHNARINAEMAEG